MALQHGSRAREGPGPAGEALLQRVRRERGLGDGEGVVQAFGQGVEEGGHGRESAWAR